MFEVKFEARIRELVADHPELGANLGYEISDQSVGNFLPRHALLAWRSTKSP